MEIWWQLLDRFGTWYWGLIICVFFPHVFLFIVKQFVRSWSCQKLDIDFSLENFQLARTLVKRKGLTLCQTIDGILRLKFEIFFQYLENIQRIFHKITSRNFFLSLKFWKKLIIVDLFETLRWRGIISRALVFFFKCNLRRSDTNNIINRSMRWSVRLSASGHYFSKDSSVTGSIYGEKMKFKAMCILNLSWFNVG